jgi:nitroimidazol reductase NimA-like FMN-containing flavoprotein (pyridoxamine 5'-phosphate oxidase superfamily)
MSEHGWTPVEGLRVLTYDECVTLLRRHRFGRLALGVQGWPAILPVNYLYDGTSVVIRTAPGAKLDEAPMTAVAFEIDDADRFGHWGWSVLVQGPAFDITMSGDELSEHLRDLPVRPWAPGARDHWLKIAAVRISGRAFGEPELD